MSDEPTSCLITILITYWLRSIYDRDGGTGGAPVHILADQLTLSGPGGQIKPTTLHVPLPRISDLPTVLPMDIELHQHETDVLSRADGTVGDMGP